MSYILETKPTYCIVNEKLMKSYINLKIHNEELLHLLKCSFYQAYIFVKLLINLTIYKFSAQGSQDLIDRTNDINLK